jgi:hypothetical protein
MLLDSEDPRLSKHDRDALRQIALRLKASTNTHLPPGYAEEMARVFGGCGEEGDLNERGKNPIR